MIIFNIPIKLSQIPRIATGWATECMQGRTAVTGSARKISFVYFSYNRDFEFLRLSLQSLVRNISPTVIGEIYLFVDQKAVFSEEQKNILRGVYPQLQLRKVEGFSWASTETTLAEIHAFKEVAEVNASNSFIAKVDSDILFFKNKRLERTIAGTDRAVGDGHYTNYRFAQGGFYLIECSIIQTLPTNDLRSRIEQAEETEGQVGEDAVISRILKQLGSPFRLNRLMLFPDEYRRLSKLNALVRWEFCALHCVQDKESMISIAQSLMPNG